MQTFTDPDGPIEEFSWGRFIILGKVHSDQGEGVGKDIRLIDNSVTEWKERKGHYLEPTMVTGVLEHSLTTLIIGIGVDSALDVPAETRKHIQDKGISRLILLPTPEACGMYNRLIRSGNRVGLLAHGTC
jgi:hypothetical protein